MKLFEVDFEPMWPVPSGLIILANNKLEAWEIANKTLAHVTVVPDNVKEIIMDKPKVIFFESGDY